MDLVAPSNADVVFPVFLNELHDSFLLFSVKVSGEFGLYGHVSDSCQVGTLLVYAGTEAWPKGYS